MIKVFIPRYRTVDQPNRKSHTEFEINVYVSGKLHVLESRYREFHDLHKKLKKLLVVTPDFPPKRIKNWNPRVLEERRIGLEHYCQELTKLDPIPTPFLIFLDIPAFNTPTTLNANWEDEPISHQRILSFKNNLYVNNYWSDELPDIVVKGVTMGLFSN